MKKLTSIFLLLLFVWTVQAQTAREEIRANRYLSANNYYAYPTPTAKQTAAPKGYEPFYISTYMRHGSRYLIDPNDYRFPKQTLLKADSLNKLTTTGKNTLDIVLRMADMAEGRLGELTSVGARQHRGIAKRMYTNFPQIFADGTEVDARSTVVIRCILSMTSECLQLQAMNPNLCIKNDASYHDMYYMNYDDTLLFKKRMPTSAMVPYTEFCKNHEHPERVMRLLFNDDDYWKNHLNADKLYEVLFKQASNVQSTELRKSMSLYDLFTDDEIYDLWQINNAWWYINYGACPLNGGKQPYSQRNLLRKIISDADSCIALPHPGATLRYGHDTMVMPLTCLMDLDGMGMQVSDLEQLAYKGWNNYRIFPMACNIQLVFYHKKGSKDILVKVLRNENEATLPIKTDIAPYYHWKDVRQYYLDKLNKFTE